ncbi:related to auxin-resistance protein [Phialocephala subalpina]|uniref:NEDD8-activating enzyme E1 regulatory subunit n=1 Tax=Phialocephala subalpina TaxID=576137 RepID=A0A1L7XDW9_9HELO|nr:related to auxin-resistance protein [Phialocephala subalpina]
MTEVITDPTPPILHGPSDKEKKYDRQLRLWAASGQQALEDAHILLLNSGSGAVGVETLKNLVLPGIGQFTIADAGVVTEADLGVNFFLDEDSLGNSRAECCVKLLQELNPDVKGHWLPLQETLTVQKVLKNDAKYTLIIYTYPIEETDLDFVQEYSIKHKVPVISVHSSGFYSYFRTYLPGNFPIVDTHPDSTATTDLRLLTPWEELSKFSSELTGDIDNLSAHEHGHLPYLVILLHFLEKWKAEHRSLPSTYKEKTAFRSLVTAGARTDNPEGGEENFDEAAAAVLKTISAPTLSSSVKAVFDYEPNELEAKSNFWIIASAVKQFYEKHKQLPLPGSVPDMKAQSTVYVRLQNIYKKKARQDVAEVLSTVRAHPGGKDVDETEVESFCKNAAFIKLIHGSEANPESIKTLTKSEAENDANAEMTMMPLSLLPIYLSLHATSHMSTASSSDILATIDQVYPDASTTPRYVEISQEVARAKGGELHNISALTGGMVAQEVIKIITKQYIPIDNTCIFDGITSRTQVLRI